MENSLYDLKDKVEAMFQKVEKKDREMKNRRGNIGKLKDHSNVQYLDNSRYSKKKRGEKMCMGGERSSNKITKDQLQNRRMRICRFKGPSDLQQE